MVETKSPMKLPRVAHIGWLAASHVARRAAVFAEHGLYTVVITDFIPPHLDKNTLPYHVEILPGLQQTTPEEQIEWLQECLQKHSIDILHIHSTHYPASLGFFVHSIPRITSIWDFVHSKDPVSPLFHKVILDELYEGSLTDAISFSSKPVMEKWIANGYPQQHAFWHSWGVDLSSFSASHKQCELSCLREQLQIRQDEKIIFSPRTQSLPANNDLLIRVLPDLAQAEKVKCIITGPCFPPESRYMEELYRNPAISSKILFVPPIRDKKVLSQFYQISDVVVSLHSNDYNPATVLEAMACGAVILINESDTVEYWIQHEKNGLVCKIRDRQDLINKLNAALSLPPATISRWTEINKAIISNEADFDKTVIQVINDYKQIQQNHSASQIKKQTKHNFDNALLNDICGRWAEALSHYNLAQKEKEASIFLAELIKEKTDFLSGEKGVESFHRCRGESIIAGMIQLPQEQWPFRIRSLKYPNHLYRHDLISGFYPFLKKGKIEEILHIISLLRRQFHTGTVEWIAEICNWFGSRWQMWEECSKLLLSMSNGGSSLGIHALLAAKNLGDDHRNYSQLLEKARDWTSTSISAINHDLDLRFRKNVYEESNKLMHEFEMFQENRG